MCTYVCACVVVRACAQAVPRVALQLTDKQRRDLEDAGLALPKPLPTLYEAISADEDAVLRTIMQARKRAGTCYLCCVGATHACMQTAWGPRCGGRTPCA